MSQKIFAYVRVSTKEQNVDRQLVDLREIEGMEERNIFIDKISGKDFERPAYQALKYALREGDLLYIHSIDRLGRNSKEIKKEWEEITHEIQADVRVLDMPLLDTTQYKDTLGTFVSDLILQVLSFVAEREREENIKRTRQGIDVAKAKGKHLGRPRINLSTLTDEQMQTLKDYYPDWKNEYLTGVKFQRMLELKRTSFYKIIKEYEDKYTHEKKVVQ